MAIVAAPTQLLRADSMPKLVLVSVGTTVWLGSSRTSAGSRATSTTPGDFKALRFKSHAACRKALRKLHGWGNNTWWDVLAPHQRLWLCARESEACTASPKVSQSEWLDAYELGASKKRSLQKMVRIQRSAIPEVKRLLWMGRASLNQADTFLRHSTTPQAQRRALTRWQPYQRFHAHTQE